MPTPPIAIKEILAAEGVGSQLELMLKRRMERAGLPTPHKQFQFHPVRKWAADFAFPEARLLVEVDGGAYVQGRHTRGKGFEEDCIKLSTAAALGWRTIRVTKRLIEDGQAVELIRQALSVGGTDDLP